MRGWITAFWAMALWLLPAVAMAAEGGDAHGHHGESLSLWDAIINETFFWSVINFLILLLILGKILGKPMANFLNSRRSTVEQGLEEAARLKKEAEATKATYDKRLQGLHEEMARIRSEMISAGESDRDRILAEAETKAARMRKETEFLIEQQMKQLRIDLTREAVNAAVTSAEKVLVETSSPADQERIAKGYLERLKASEKPGDRPRQPSNMPRPEGRA